MHEHREATTELANLTGRANRTLHMSGSEVFVLLRALTGELELNDEGPVAELGDALAVLAFSEVEGSNMPERLRARIARKVRARFAHPEVA